MKRCLLLRVLGTVLFLFCSFNLCMAKVFVVSTVDEFQDALTEAAMNTEHDTIKVAPGTYHVTETLTYLPSVLNCMDYEAPCITHGDITIEAQDENNRPVFDGGNNVRIMVLRTVNNGYFFCGGYFNGELFCGEKITIRGLIFQNGKANDDNYGSVGGLYAAAKNLHGKVTLENCVFIHNERKDDVSNAYGGGASLWAGKSITVKNSEFYRNVGRWGGGLYCNGPSTVEGNIFEENEADQGGGFYGPTNSLILQKNIFRNNHASEGGGAFTGSYEDQHLNIVDNIFENNSANYTGALYAGFRGFYSAFSAPGGSSIIGNTFINNQSKVGYGGAVRLDSIGSQNLIMNNVFYGNISGTSTYGDYRHGGAIYAWGTGNITIINNTIYGNVAARVGGGIYIQKSTYEYGGWEDKKVSIYNNIIWGNTANNGGNDGDDVYVEVHPSNESHIYGPVYVYNNILGENSDVETGISEDYVVYHRYSSEPMDRYYHGANILQNPLLIDPANANFHIDPHSPAINAGENSILPTDPNSGELIIKTDFEGDPRIIEEVVDIGADEYNGAAHQFFLNVNKEGEGSGSVSSVPEGISCGDTCSASFDGGEEVTLTATADEGSQFAGWSGDCEGCKDATCTITMDSDKTCTANFEPIPNEPPVIDSFTAEPTSGDAPLTVTFTCEAHDPDGTIASYAWDFDGDGIVDETSETGTISHKYTDPGTYQATCTVIDDDGESVTSEPLSITVNKPAPSWVDITNTLNITHSRRQLYDRVHRCFFIQVTVENPGDAISGPIRLVITNPSIPVKTGVGVGLEPDGYTAQGDLYFTIVPDGGSLGAGEVLQRLRINFELQRKRLTYGIKVEQLR